jgi:hypothetical protein
MKRGCAALKTRLPGCKPGNPDRSRNPLPVTRIIQLYY